MNNDIFIKQLNNIGLEPDVYLKCAKILARKTGYDPNKLDFALNNNNKLKYITPDDKIIYFGKAKYNDFIIWTFLEQNGKAPEGQANKKRYVFLNLMVKCQKYINLENILLMN